MSIQVREVVLELLRHGHAHNQLLSPLTRYLALCGSHPAVTLTVPFEHRKLQHLLSRMRYQRGTDSAFARNELSDAVTALLDQIPALPHEGRVDDGQILHLRLMITPQELAILPFELAQPPSGFNTGGQPLLIGPTPDVVLTREVRRAGSVPVRVPDKPRILFAAADPNELGIPFVAHRDALAAAVRPWVHPRVREGELQRDLEPHLVVLERASLDEIRAQCETGGFTHVHILAHGEDLVGDEREGFGVALWNRDKTGPEVAVGTALSQALLPPEDSGTWASPWCVMLCTCDSSNIGGVVHPTASVAHALHVAGVPFVVASQYPLTFGAAETLVRRFYPLELCGEDPRRTLRDVRHAISSRMRGTHDWASLVAYANWPADLAAQLEEIRVVRAFMQLEAAQDWADRTIAGADRRSDEYGADVASNKIIQYSLELVQDAAERLRREYAANEEKREEVYRRHRRGLILKHEKVRQLGKFTALLTETCGLLGSAAKRRARLLAHRGSKSDARDALREATTWYLKGAELEAPEHWTACQSFVMLGLGLHEDGWSSEKEKKRAKELWKSTVDTATRALREPEGRVWAYGTLVEVELWRSVLGSSSRAAHQRSIEKAQEYARKQREEVGADPFPARSTARQLRRYRDWWAKAGYIDRDMVKAVTQVLESVEAEDPDDDGFADIESFEPETADRFDEVIVDRTLGEGKVQKVSIGGPDAAAEEFRVQMLPARQGDALWVEYGPADDLRRILIDGGFRTTVRIVEKRIRELAKQREALDGKCHFELGVVTHIDADHIEGIVELLGSGLPVSFGDFWFNGRRHLDMPAVDPSMDDEPILGGKHGLFMDTTLELSRTNWNTLFGGAPVVVPPAPARLPAVELPGGMQLTLLSPTPQKLTTLARRWDIEVRKAGLEGANVREVLRDMNRLHFRTEAIDEDLLGRKKPSGPLDIDALLAEPDGADDTPANGSSIAFLAEYDGRSCLFLADAHPDALLDAIDRLAGGGNRLKTDAVKLSHHGSGNNVTLELLRRLDSRVFMVSTNGGGGHFHPDRHAIAKLVAGNWRPIDEAHRLRILFNYRSEYTEIWEDEALQNKYHYDVDYAEPGNILELSIGREGASD